jgi:SPW repeat
VPAARRAEPGAGRIPAPILAGRAALAGGVWLIAAPFLLDYSTTGSGFRAYWNDVAVGLAVVALMVPRVAVPVRTAGRLATVTGLLGCWLAVSPFVLGYAGDLPRAAVSDVLVGAALAALAVPTLSVRRA